MDRLLCNFHVVRVCRVSQILDLLLEIGLKIGQFGVQLFQFLLGTLNILLLA